MAAALLAACGGDDEETVDRYSGLVVSSEFVPGLNRFPFGLVSRDGEFLEDATVTVRFFSLGQYQRSFHVEASAAWRTIQGTTPHEHPDGEVHLHLDFRGLYVVDEVELAEAGIWLAEFDVVAPDGTRPIIEEAAFEVRPGPSAPGVGEPVPATMNLTIHEAPFEQLSTRRVEGDELHNVSVAQALDAGEPFVVFFASPQFCVSAMCGPVTDTMEQAQAQLSGAVVFIHIEPWDLVAARERGELVAAPVVREWRLLSEPWTFVVDGDGLVAARFEGLVTVDEILAALEALA